MKYPINYNDAFVDDFGSVKRNEPDENYIDIRVEMSSFRNMVAEFANMLAARKVITEDESKIFYDLYNLTVRGDIYGKSVTARVYKNSFAIANSESLDKNKKVHK